MKKYAFEIQYGELEIVAVDTRDLGDSSWEYVRADEALSEIATLKDANIRLAHVLRRLAAEAGVDSHADCRDAIAQALAVLAELDL